MTSHDDCFVISGHYSALARLINLLRRAGTLDECSKYIEQVGGTFFLSFFLTSIEQRMEQKLSWLIDPHLLH